MGRLQLGGQPTSPLELVLSAGINTRLAPHEAATRLTSAVGVVWNTRYYLTTGAAYLAPIFKPVAETTPTYGSTITYTAGVITLPAGLQRNLVFGRKTGSGAQQIGFWRTDGGAEQTITAGGTATLTPANCEYPMSAVLWGDLGTPYVFVAHPKMDRVYRIDLGGTVNTNAGSTWYIRRWGATGAAMSSGSIAAWPTSGTSEPDGMAALCVHLDRLWGILNGPAGTGNVRTCKVYYTDPLDSTIIRPNSFVQIPDFGTALARSSLGGIGVGGDAQLIVGCMSSIWVIDGDPTLGNSIRRQLKSGVGVLASCAMVETDHGVAFLGTDGQCYLIRPGAQQVDPIGEDIFGSFTGYRPALLDGTGATPIATLAWMPPYLVVWNGSGGAYYACDLADPQQPRWYGQHTTGGVAWLTPVSAVASPSVGAEPAARLVGTSGSAALSTLSLTTTPADGAEFLQSGEITLPGHKVSIRRVVVETAASSGTTAITVTLRKRPSGSAVSTMTPAFSSVVRKTVFVFPVDTMADGLVVQISANNAMKIRRVWAEMRVEPAQDIR